MSVTWDESADVIVIGTGFAGLTAAIKAAQSGVSVLVLEKMKGPGGNSLISDGGVAAAGTVEQADACINDSVDLMYSDMMKAGLGINHPELVRTLAEQSAEAFEWSKNFLGVNYLDRIDIFGGHSVARCFTAENVSGVSIIKKLMGKIQELSIPVHYQSLLKDFVFDQNHKISGVLVQNNYKFKLNEGGHLHNIKANKAVILASGGFGSDVEFRSLQDPRLDKSIKNTTQQYSTAEAMKVGIKAGAAAVQLSRIQLAPWTSPDETGSGDGTAFSEYIVFQYGVIIDPATGKRIVNELADRKSLSDEILKVGQPCIGIADSKAVNESGWNIEKAIKKQVVKTFDSLAALAQAYKIDKIQLEDTISQFNKSVVNKKDPDFNKPILETAKEIIIPPYYAIRLWPKVHHTMGGLGINSKAQVLDLNGDIIKGLFAAGEVTGGVHGASRLGSCAITECFVFGRIAGRGAAEEIDN
jgi:flavocytochrome c